MPETCPFCNLDQSRVVRIGRFTTTLLSNPTLAEFHALVVPNAHVESPLDLTPNQLTEIDAEQDRITRRILGRFATVVRLQKFAPMIAEGTNNKVNHVHFHVLADNPGSPLHERGLAWGDPGSWRQLDDTRLGDSLKMLTEDKA